MTIRVKTFERKIKLKIIDNDEFVARNFSKLIAKYPHQRVVICNGEIFTGEDAATEARRKFPRCIPMSLPIPSSDELVRHVL